MKERFPQPAETPSIEEKIRETFWDKEIKTFFATYKGEEMSRMEQKRRVANNIKRWLPFIEKDSFHGYGRSKQSLAIYKEEGPEKVRLVKQLIKDVDAYLKARGLEDFAKAVSDEYVGVVKAQRAVFMTEKKAEFPPQILKDEEVSEFYTDLYYYLRTKGYPRELLST